MAINFTGKITYVQVTDDVDKLMFDLQGDANISKGLTDYFATPDWQTVWRIYDNYGSKVFEDARHHSMMPFSTGDNAHDDFTARVNRSGNGVYTIQLFGKISGDMAFIEQESINVGSNEIVTTPPMVPTPQPVPDPVNLPTTPNPLPEGQGLDLGIPKTIFGISTGLVIVTAVVLGFILLKK